MSSEWLTTDRPDVVACMGSVPACAEWGCQARKLDARLQALTGYVRHKPECGQWLSDDECFCGVTFSQPQLNPKRACSCGLADLLTPASAEEPEKSCHEV